MRSAGSLTGQLSTGYHPVAYLASSEVHRRQIDLNGAFALVSALMTSVFRPDPLGPMRPILTKSAADAVQHCTQSAPGQACVHPRAGFLWPRLPTEPAAHRCDQFCQTACPVRPSGDRRPIPATGDWYRRPATSTEHRRRADAAGNGAPCPAYCSGILVHACGSAAVQYEANCHALCQR